MKNWMTSLKKAFFLAMLMATSSLFAQNLIDNGNFNDATPANFTFQTQYTYSWGLGGDNDVGKYCVSANANNHSTSMFNFGDHTGGGGCYMIVNGATTEDLLVWGKTVPVQPHSFYDFTMWVTNLSQGGGSAISPWMKTKLRLKINGQIISDDWTMPTTYNNQGYWNQMTTYPWYSGSATSATIEIIDRCTSENGNDFGLDDISFTYLYSNVVEANADDLTTCFNVPIEFNPLDNDVISPSNLDVDFMIWTQTTHGTLQSLGGTNYRYTPHTDFSGVDSFTYRLRYGSGTNAITSYGLVTITVNPRPQRTINLDACESYTWSYTGQTYTQSNTYEHVKPGPNGCDSLLILNLTIHHNEEETLEPETACDSYTWHGTTYTQSGTYDYSTTNEWGCVFTQHLPLTINHSDTLVIPQSACESFTWYGNTYTQTGQYPYWTTNPYNCDRLEILDLTISDQYVENIYETECDAYYWPRKQQWYYANAEDYATASGPPGGCDSTFYLHLTIHYSDTIEFTEEECDSFTWHGTTYTSSGNYSYETTNPDNCPRIELLHLTIHESQNIPLPDTTVCDQFVWHGETYTQNGVAVFDTVNQYGCHVQYTLPVTINHSDTLPWVYEDACESYFWYGQNITETGTYFHHSTNEYGCDRLERLYVTMDYNTSDTLPPQIACDSYDWHGEEYTTSGWKTYEEEGLAGCVHREVIFLTINHSTEKEFTVQSCDPYTWFDSTYTESGTYYHLLTNAVGCDSLLVLNLTIGGEVNLYEFADTGCEFYEWRDSIYTASGTYYDTVFHPNGCDDVFKLTLTIEHNYDEETWVESCYSYTWFDETFNESGDHQKHFTAVTQCDSLVTLHLTIKDAVYHDFEQQTCELPYTWNSIDYYYEGDYEQTFDAANGCDSIVTMHLVLRDALMSEFDYQSCKAIPWYEHNCDHDDDYTHHFTSVQGCDSIVTMHFTLTETLNHEYDTVACNSFEWYGQVCDHDDDYTHTFITQQGCDSIVTMHMRLNVTQMSTQFRQACDSISINGVIYDESGTDDVSLSTIPSEHGCDSIIYRICLTVRNSSEMAHIEGLHHVYVATNIFSGIYRYEIDTTGIISDITWSLTNPEWRILDHDAVSCRIMVTSPGSGILKANFQVEDCGEMERQFEINGGFFGTDEHQMVEAHIYPNPTKGTVTIEAKDIQRVRVVNMLGQTLEAIEGLKQDQVSLNLTHFAPSVYLMEIETRNGMARKSIVISR